MLVYDFISIIGLGNLLRVTWFTNKNSTEAIFFSWDVRLILFCGWRPALPVLIAQNRHMGLLLVAVSICLPHHYKQIGAANVPLNNNSLEAEQRVQSAGLKHFLCAENIPVWKQIVTDMFSLFDGEFLTLWSTISVCCCNITFLCQQEKSNIYLTKMFLNY